MANKQLPNLIQRVLGTQRPRHKKSRRQESWPYVVIGYELTKYFSSNFGGWKPPKKDRKRGGGPSGERNELLNPTLVSSAHGKIERILFFLPSYALNIAEMRNAFCRVFSKLPSHLYYEIVYNEDSQALFDALIAEAGIEGRVKPIPIPRHILMTIWAQDAYVVATDDSPGRGWCFLEPIFFRRFGDAYLADLAGGNDVFQQPTYFEGGNILVGDQQDFCLVGYDHISQTKKYRTIIARDEAHLKDIFRSYIETRREMHFIRYSDKGKQIVPFESEDTTINGKKWIVIDGTNPGLFQPVFHLDMFLTLAGRNHKGQYRILFGDPKTARKILGLKKPHKFAKEKLFRTTYEYLKQTYPNFEFIKNPLPLVRTFLSRDKAKLYFGIVLPEDIQGLIIYYFASYNNCLVEIPYHQNPESCQVDERPSVWLPTYGFKHWKQLKYTDVAMKGLWNSLGFQVCELGDFHPFAFQGGAIHCLSKELEREKPASFHSNTTYQKDTSV